MRLRRRPDAARSSDSDTDTGADRPPEGEPVVVEKQAARPRRTLADLLVVVTGAALVVLGIVALSRAGIDDSWYRPVVQVGGIDQTPLLAAIGVGVGSVLVILGLVGARVLSALVLVGVAIGAVVVAVDPGRVERELALEQGWAIAAAVIAGLLAVLLLRPRPATTERRSRATAWRSGRGRAVHQH